MMLLFAPPRRARQLLHDGELLDYFFLDFLEMCVPGKPLVPLYTQVCWSVFLLQFHPVHLRLDSLGQEACGNCLSGIDFYTPSYAHLST